jgi:hypothetical protein
MPILSPILVRPSLGQKKQSKHKDSQDMGSFRASCRKKMNSWGLPVIYTSFTPGEKTARSTSHHPLLSELLIWSDLGTWKMEVIYWNETKGSNNLSGSLPEKKERLNSTQNRSHWDRFMHSPMSRTVLGVRSIVSLRTSHDLRDRVTSSFSVRSSCEIFDGIFVLQPNERPRSLYSVLSWHLIVSDLPMFEWWFDRPVYGGRRSRLMRPLKRLSAPFLRWWSGVEVSSVDTSSDSQWGTRITTSRRRTEVNSNERHTRINPDFYLSVQIPWY